MSTDEQKTKRPNLLVIYTDQQSSWTLGCYGGKLVETPAIDSIGNEGAVLENFFTNSAVCTPSRGCFLTGRYPHSNGAYTNNHPFAPGQLTVADVLAEAGYETGYAGKWHLQPRHSENWLTPDRSNGFADCQWMYNNGHPKSAVQREGEKPELTHVTNVGRNISEWLADKAVEFLGRGHDKPFFYMVSFPDPHTPFTVNAPYDTMYDPEDMPLPETFYEKDRPDWLDDRSDIMHIVCEVDTDPSERETLLKLSKARYCGEVKCIDDNVARILDCLKQKGILDDTVVVFTTDHGEYMGEHGIYFKNQFYETAYRIPMLIRWPKSIVAGTRIDRIVDTVDFQQTILALMGVEPVGNEQGVDASGLLRGETVEWTDESFIHHNTLERAGIFTPEYELGYVKGSQDHILFDRVNDPLQKNNLFRDPTCREVIARLTERIIEHHAEVESPALEWLKAL